MFRSIVIAAGLLFASTAVAQTADESSAPPATAKPVKEKKICKLEAADSSISRMRKSVCRTARQWAEQAEGRSNADDLRRARP